MFGGLTLEVTCSVELLDHLTEKKQKNMYLGSLLHFRRSRKVAKYVGFSKLWSEDDARALAEPEDQAVKSSLHVCFFLGYLCDGSSSII